MLGVSFETGRGRAERLTALRKDAAAIEFQIETLEDQRRDAAHNATIDYTGLEQRRADNLAAQITLARGRLSEVEAKIASIEAEDEAILAKQREKAAIDRIRSIPRLRKSYAEGVEMVQRSAEQLGDAMREQIARGKALADALQTEEAQKQFGKEGVIKYRYQIHLPKYFCTKPANSDGGINGVSMLDVPLTMGHNQSHRLSLIQGEASILAELAGFYATREDALIARKIADPSGENLHPVEDVAGRVWLLRRGQFRGGFRPMPDDASDPQAD